MTTAAVAAYKSLHRLPFTKLVWGIANQIGVLEALLLEVIEDWCQNNATAGRGKYHHDDEWWTAATYQEWSEMYPCLGSPRKLQRILLKLEADGYLVSGQFLSGQWNQTKFYRPNPEKVGQLILGASKSTVTSRSQIVPKVDALENEMVPEMDTRLSNQEMMEHPPDEHSSINRSEIRSINQITPPNPPLKGGQERERQFGFEMPEPEEEGSSNILAKASQSQTTGSQVTTVSGEGKFSVAVAPQTIRKYDPALGMVSKEERRTIQQIQMDWVPDGPWKVEGKLDDKFVDWKAAKWVRDWGKDFYTARGHVLQHFKKDAANLAIAWDEYHREHLHRFSTAAITERSGGTVKDKDQLLEHINAVTNPLPQEMAPVNYTVPNAVKEYTPDIAQTIEGRQRSLPETRPEGAEAAPETYQLYKPKPVEEKEPTPEELAANRRRIQEMTAAAFNRKMPALNPADKAKPTIFPQNPTVEQLQELLLDTAIKKDIVFQRQLQQWLGAREDVVGDYDESGQIYMIERF